MSTPILNYSGFPSLVSSGAPVPGYLVYWDTINALTLAGGPGDGPVIGPRISLDTQTISDLPDNSIIEVVTASRGASQWKRTQDTSSPVTDINAGRIVPSEYNSINSPFILIRILGF